MPREPRRPSLESLHIRLFGQFVVFFLYRKAHPSFSYHLDDQAHTSINVIKGRSMNSPLIHQFHRSKLRLQLSRDVGAVQPNCSVHECIDSDVWLSRANIPSILCFGFLTDCILCKAIVCSGRSGGSSGQRWLSWPEVDLISLQMESLVTAARQGACTPRIKVCSLQEYATDACHIGKIWKLKLTKWNCNSLAKL